MLSRFSGVLQSAADVLAPPATKLEDFEYHWKMVINFYQNYDESSKVHIEDTRVPHHLHQMLQLIVEEEEEQQQRGGAAGACLQAVVQRSVCVLDALAALAAVDRPPGARACALGVATALLRRTRRPCLHSAHVYRPLQSMLVQCGESPASPTEREEAELLLTLCGLVRQEPALADVFAAPFAVDRARLPPVPEDVRRLIPAAGARPAAAAARAPRGNPLFEVEPAGAARVRIVRDAAGPRPRSGSGSGSDSSGGSRALRDDRDKFLLVELLLAYLDSADERVVLRACEGVMIVSSLPQDDIANLVTGSPACERVVQRLAERYRRIPAHLDPGDVDQLNVTWAYAAQELRERGAPFPGHRELAAFFSWLDYCDTLAKECHPLVAAQLARAFRALFLDAAAEELLAEPRSPRRALLTTALLAKCLRAVDAPELLGEFSAWLVGEGPGCASEWPLLRALVAQCLSDDHDLTLETLRFFEAVVERGAERCMERLVLSRLSARAYLAGAPERDERADEDERDRLNDVSFARERERNREALKQLQHEQRVGERVCALLAAGAPAPGDPEPGGPGPEEDSVRRVITSFLLLLPRAVLSDPLGADYEQYVLDAQRHYQLWLDTTSAYSWPESAASSTRSFDSRPEADRPAGAGAADEPFDEGPFLRMLWELLARMPERPYRVNLHLTAVVSKLALLPHAQLHEYLLEPQLAAAPRMRTLFGALRALARRLAAELPRLRDFRARLDATRRRLLSEDPACDEAGDRDQPLESLIVLEEFCKELAAIAFVKYQHRRQQR